MKTTFDLPEDLVRQLKLRALNEGRKLKDAAADILRRGLAAPPPGGKRKPAPSPQVKKDSKTGLPVIQCRRAASSKQELTPQRVADLLIEQEMEWALDSD